MVDVLRAFSAIRGWLRTFWPKGFFSG